MLKYVPTRTWHLEMRKPPEKEIHFPEGFHVLPFEGKDSDEYLKIYKAVGGKYNWFDRLLMPAESLRSVLEAATTHIYFLMKDDEPAGFVELNTAVEGEVEIVYFGIAAQFTGLKAGSPFLLWAVNRAWEEPVERVWLHTCDLDHPAALPLYQKAGFVVYKEETVLQPVIA